MTFALPTAQLSIAHAMTGHTPAGMPGLIGTGYAILTFQNLETVIRGINDGTIENRILDLRANILAPRALTIAQDSNIVIIGNGHEIRFNNNTGGSFIVHGDLHLVSTALQGRGQGSATGVLVHSTGQLTTQGDTIISRFPASGVRVLGGSFMMQDTIIEDNAAVGGGAGVWVDTGGTFTMTSGAIRNNRPGLAAWGGAVRLERDTVFNMHGGSISGHTSGGGAGVAHHGVFNMTGGNIYNNTASVHLGGGVHVGQHGTFIMSGNARISNNTANTDGGGVDVSANGTFTMNGGTITNNTAQRQSGGVHTRPNGTLSTPGGVISGNTAPAFPDVFGVISLPPINPEIVIITPIPTVIIRAQFFDVHFRGIPTPQNSITALHYTVNGGANISIPMVSLPFGNFRADLEPGTNEIEIFITDSSGATGSTSFEVTALREELHVTTLRFADLAASVLYFEETFNNVQENTGLDLSAVRANLSGLNLSESQLDSLRVFLENYLRSHGVTGWDPPSRPADEQLARAAAMENAIVMGINSARRHGVGLFEEAQFMFIANHKDRPDPFWRPYRGIIKCVKELPITMERHLTPFLTFQDRLAYRNYMLNSGFINLFAELGHAAVLAYSAMGNPATATTAAQLARDKALSSSAKQAAGVVVAGINAYEAIDISQRLAVASQRIANAFLVNPNADPAQLIERYIAELPDADILSVDISSLVAIICSFVLGTATRAIPKAIIGHILIFGIDFARNFLHTVSWTGMRMSYSIRHGLRLENMWFGPFR